MLLLKGRIKTISVHLKNVRVNASDRLWSCQIENTHQVFALITEIHFLEFQWRALGKGKQQSRKVCFVRFAKRTSNAQRVHTVSKAGATKSFCKKLVWMGRFIHGS